jgi:O-antigen/teichoic acid export membrane protein
MLGKEKFYYLIGLIGSKSPFFLLIPLLSFYFNKSQIGKIDLILVTVTLLLPLISFQLGEASFRFLKEYSNSKVKIITTALICILINLVAFASLSYAYYLFSEIQEVLWFTLIFIASTVISNLLLIYRGLNKIKSYALLGLMSGSFSLILISVTLSQTISVLNIAIMFSIGHFAALVVSLYESSFLKYFKFAKFSKKLLYSLLLYSIPLIPNAVSWWFIDLGNRYIINFTLGDEYLGIFAVAARYIVIIAFINNFFLLLWQDYYLSESSNKDELGFNFEHFVKVQISIIILVISISFYLIKFGAGDEFIDSYKYVGPIGLSLFISSLSAYAGVEYLKIKKTKQLFISTLIGGLVNIILAFILVNFLDLYGIVLSSIIGFLITLYLRLKDSYVLIKLFKKIKYKLLGGVLTMSIVYIIQLSGSPLLIITAFFLVLLGLLIWNKQNINKYIIK